MIAATGWADALRAFVAAVVPAMECEPTGDAAARYHPVFSTGNSGLSFGAFQHDVRANPAARAVFTRLLGDAVATGLITSDEVASLPALACSDAAARARQPPTAAQIDRIARVLASGRAAIDDLDRDQAEVLRANVQALLDRLAPFTTTRPQAPALAMLAAWANRTGGLGATAAALAARRTAPTPDAVADHLRAQAQFRPRAAGGRGEDFTRWQVRILTHARTFAPLLDGAGSDPAAPPDLARHLSKPQEKMP